MSRGGLWRRANHHGDEKRSGAACRAARRQPGMALSALSRASAHRALHIFPFSNNISARQSSAGGAFARATRVRACRDRRLGISNQCRRLSYFALASLRASIVHRPLILAYVVTK